jgi:molybdate transport system permease protein
LIDALTRSLLLALSSSLVLLLLGVPLAWWLVRYRGAWRRLLETFILLPLTLPPTVLGFYLLLALGRDGWFSKIIGTSWAFRFEGLLIGSVLFSLPFALTAYREALRALDPDWLQAASVEGASTLQTWRFVILPIAAPGIFSGTLLAFAHTLGEFGVVLMIGGNISGQTTVISTYIYDLTQSLQFSSVNTVALILFVTSFVILYIARTFEERARENSTSWRK